MPRNTVTEVQKALLRECSDGAVIVGILGARLLHANVRVFQTSDGVSVAQGTVTSLLGRGLLKVISDDGPRRYYTVTEMGRQMAQAGRIHGVRMRVE